MRYTAVFAVDSHLMKPDSMHNVLDSAELAGQVKSWAVEENFDLCGIAEAGEADPQGRLRQWIGAGFHADMHWLARSRGVREDVRVKLPGAQSVVVVGRNYYSERPPEVSGTGRVARYAWGRDYHRVLRKPLRRLAQKLDALEPGAESYCCVDSGPVLERTWAARAGIGAVGKNSLILNRELGSWFFLGVILTTVRLEPDESIDDLCGTCTACLDACPTGAIVEAQVVDANRCISYHTIENRGDVPEPIAEQFSDWVFGCDICQEVCPWNRFRKVTNEADFHPRGDHAQPGLDTLQALSDEEFSAEFEGTPILRAKASGMRRNAAIAQRNAGD